jgi:hypothetical protein
MRIRVSLLALLTLVLFVLGCGPAIAAARPPASPDDDPEPIEIPENAGAIVQASAAAIAPVAAQRLVPSNATGFVDPDMRAPTTTAVLDGPKLGHDPQVAAGDRFLIVYTAHRYQILDKATGLPVAAAGEVAPTGDFSTIFSAFWSPNASADQNINHRLGFAATDPLRCDPAAPTGSHACVQEFYDTRIHWDPWRKRFWIESAARNHLWFCQPGDKCDQPKQTWTQARRYIAVAVSRTEDPRQGFHRYILVNRYKDWPKMAIHDRYLILGHRASSTIWVYDADKLAAGNPDRGPVRLAKLVEKDFPGVRFLAPVTHHGPTNGLTYLLGSDGSERVKIFALVNGAADHATRPTVIASAPVTLGAKLGTLEGNAIYRDGALYFTWDQWAPGHTREYRQIRVVRLPVIASPASLFAITDPHRGYVDAIIGGREPDDAPGAVMDYEKPALDVSDTGAAVVVYSRKSFRADVEVPPEVRYSILYPGETRARPGLLVRRGSTSAVPDVDDNGKAGIDLAFAQVDPSDDHTVWITHAYADARVRWYRQVVAAVRP